GDVPVDLGQPARDLVVGVAIAVGGTTRPGEHAGLVLLLHLAADIHEQAVLDQRATGVHAVAPRVDFDLLALLVDQAVVGSRIVVMEGVLVVGTQAGGPVGHQAAELPLVAAALGPDVDHAAGRTAGLCAVAAGDDLHLADAVERQAGGAEVGERVGDRVTVDVERVLGCGRAAEGRRTRVARVRLDNARGEQRHRL